jgi:hypothetical protein
MDRPSVNRQTVRKWTDLCSTDRPSGDGQTFGQQTDRRRWTNLRSTDRPSGDEQTFGQQTDRLAMNRPSVNRQTVWQWPGGGQMTEDRSPPKSKAHDGNVKCRPYPRRLHTRCGVREATLLASGEKSPALNGTRPKAAAACTAAAETRAVPPRLLLQRAHEQTIAA